MRDSRFPLPAIIASILLHIGILALGLLHFSKHMQFGEPVPVSIVSSDEFKAPDIAPVPTPAEAPPTPQAAEPTPPPPPPPAQQTPTPEPPKPVESKAPSAKPQKASAAPSQVPSACQQNFMACIGKVVSPSQTATRPTGKPSTQIKPTMAPKHSPTAQQARQALSGLVGKVQDRWVLDCDVAGTKDVIAPVRFTVGYDGRLTEGPDLVNRAQEGTLVAQAARAAVKAAQPYSLQDVPADYRNTSITLNFSAKEACASK